MQEGAPNPLLSGRKMKLVPHVSVNKLGQFGVISEEFTSGQQRPPPARPSLAPAPHYKLFSLTAPFVSGVGDLTAPWPAWGAWL